MRSFYRCQCTANVFCPKDWGPNEGLTLKQCLARGYTVLTIFKKFEGAAKRPSPPIPPRKD